MTAVIFGGINLNTKKKVKSKSERTKEKIYQTAISLFIEKGYENTTVQEITEKVDVAKGTFFTHFPTKDSILTYLGEQRLDMMKNDLEIELMSISSAKEQILKIFEFLALANEEDKEITKLISLEILKNLYSPELKNEVENLLELNSFIERILKKGQQAGEFKKDFSPNQVADILIGVYFFILLKWLAEDEKISLVEEYRDRVAIILEGIAIDDRKEN